ncbi:MAG: biotin/lipoyl-containing protein, partial [Candidatus Methylopumilus sp.]
MANTFQITVPDIGNFDSVEVIDVMVKVGDIIKKEDSLITVESDKASMDIPSTHEGKVTSINLKVGDKVKQGSHILVIELNESNTKPQKAETPKEVKSETKVDIKKESPPEITSQSV